MTYKPINSEKFICTLQKIRFILSLQLDTYHHLGIFGSFTVLLIPSHVLVSWDHTLRVYIIRGNFIIHIHKNKDIKSKKSHKFLQNIKTNILLKFTETGHHCILWLWLWYVLLSCTHFLEYWKAKALWPSRTFWWVDHSDH